MAETRDDYKTFTISLAAIGKFQIVSYSFPGTQKEGGEVDGTVTVKNTGGVMAELRVKLIDVFSEKVIDKEPDLYYKNVNPGETVTLKVGTSWDPFWAMPAKDWNLRVEAWRQV